MTVELDLSPDDLDELLVWAGDAAAQVKRVRLDEGSGLRAQLRLPAGQTAEAEISTKAIGGALLVTVEAVRAKVLFGSLKVPSSLWEGVVRGLFTKVALTAPPFVSLTQPPGSVALKVTFSDYWLGGLDVSGTGLGLSLERI